VSPVRPFRVLCLACLEPDRVTRVERDGRVIVACACGNVASWPLEPEARP